MRPAAPWLNGFVYYAGPQGKLESNEFWYTPTTVPSPGADYGAISDSFSAQVTPSLLAFLGSDTEIIGTKVIVNTGVVEVSERRYHIDSGTGPDFAVSEVWSAIVSKRTSGTGRSSRGRWFIGSFSRNFVDGNYLTDDGLTALGLVASDWAATFTGDGVEFQPTMYRTSDNTLHGLLDVQPVALLGTERRRRVRF